MAFFLIFEALQTEHWFRTRAQCKVSFLVCLCPSNRWRFTTFYENLRGKHDRTDLMRFHFTRFLWFIKFKPTDIMIYSRNKSKRNGKFLQNMSRKWIRLKFKCCIGKEIHVIVNCIIWFYNETIQEKNNMLHESKNMI